jgi:hypothetical protein
MKDAAFERWGECSMLKTTMNEKDPGCVLLFCCDLRANAEAL